MIGVNKGVTSPASLVEGQPCGTPQGGKQLLVGTQALLRDEQGNTTPIAGTYSYHPLGKRGAGIRVDMPTTNLFDAAGFKTVGATWGGLTTEIKEVLVMGTPHGTRNVKHVRWSAASSGGIQAVEYGQASVTAGKTYAFSAVLRLPYGSGAANNPNIIYVREFNDSDTQIREYGVFSPTNTESYRDGWLRAWAAITPAAGAVKVVIQSYYYGFEEFYGYDAQLEEGSVPTAYTATSRGRGRLAFPVSAAGSFSGFFYVTEGSPASPCQLWSVGGVSGSQDRACLTVISNTLILAEWSGGNATYTGLGAVSLYAKKWVHLCAVWAAGGISIYLDGVLKAQLSRTYGAFTLAALGSDATNPQNDVPCSALWSDIQLFNRGLTAAELDPLRANSEVALMGDTLHVPFLREGQLALPADATYLPLGDRTGSYGAICTLPVAQQNVRFYRNGRWGNALSADGGYTPLTLFDLTPYNNYPNDIKVDIKKGYEKYEGQPVFRVNITPLTATGVDVCRADTQGIGVMSAASLTFEANKVYQSSLLARQGNGKVAQISLLPSNIAGWSGWDTPFQPLVRGRFMQIGATLAADSSPRTDFKFCSITCPQINLNETYQVNLTLPTIMEGVMRPALGASTGAPAVWFRYPFKATGTLMWVARSVLPQGTAETWFDLSDTGNTRLLSISRSAAGQLLIGSVNTGVVIDQVEHFWALAWSTNGISLYRDGILVYTGGAQPLSGALNMMIGRQADSVASPANAALSHVVLLDRVLPLSEIANVTAQYSQGELSLRNGTAHVRSLCEGA